MVTIAGCSNNACENRLGVIWLHGCSNYLTFPRLVSLTAWHIQMILLFGLVVVQCIHSQWFEIDYEGEFYFHAAVLKILVKKWSAHAQYKYWQTPNFQQYRATLRTQSPVRIPSLQVLNQFEQVFLYSFQFSLQAKSAPYG